MAIQDNIIIRKGEKEDFEGFFSIISTTLWKDTLLEKENTRLLFNEQLENGKILIKAETENRIIGIITLTTRLSIQEQGLIGIIEEFAIIEEYQKKGLGKLLLTAIEKEATRKGCLEIHLSSNFKRKEAHAFYESNGFNKTAYYFWKKIGMKNSSERLSKK